MTRVTFVEEDIGHHFGRGKMLESLKSLYVDLGYVDNMEDFISSTDEPESYGRWIEFD